MGKLISIVGNSGVGKTTLAGALQGVGDYFVGLEEHTTRPFHDLCASDPERYGLANQFDFLLLRVEQEQVIRQQPRPGLVDGGLDMDFWGFAHLFHHKGILSAAEFLLCQRFYHAVRALTPPPDLLIFLDAPPEVVLERYRLRGRGHELTQADDLHQLDVFLRRWLAEQVVGNTAVVHLNATTDQYLQPPSLQQLHHTIQTHLA
ncbi:MAG: deoxynucleoside kinase [Anaerolineales bacterium]|nr:deoxynucleoside kinase [Anaerolineales bacterium]